MFAISGFVILLANLYCCMEYGVWSTHLVCDLLHSMLESYVRSCSWTNWDWLACGNPSDLPGVSCTSTHRVTGHWSPLRVFKYPYLKASSCLQFTVWMAQSMPPEIRRMRHFYASVPQPEHDCYQRTTEYLYIQSLIKYKIESLKLLAI